MLSCLFREAVHRLSTDTLYRTLKAERNGKTCTTLGVIRGFLEDQVADFPAENRVLTVSVSELKRPVKYFWGVHDFVRGIRGALLGMSISRIVTIEIIVLIR